MLITIEDYQRNPAAKRVADRILREAGIGPFDVFEIRLHEGSCIISRYRVADARMLNGRPALTFKYGPDGQPESYQMVRMRTGWVEVECSSTAPMLGRFA